MGPADILTQLKKGGASVVTTRDISKFAESRGYPSLVLNRLAKKGLVHKVRNGKYYLEGANTFAIASMVSYPSYVSYLGALYLRGLSEQIPAQIQVVSTRYARPLLINGTRVEFVKFSQRLVFGYAKKNLDGYAALVAEPEKAVLDALHVQKMPLHYVEEAMGRLDRQQLIGYAKKFDSAVVKRVGYLLEKNGHDCYSELKAHLNYKYVLLRTSGKRSGRRVEKWKVIDNR